MLGHETRAVTVVARTAVEVLVLSAEDARKFLAARTVQYMKIAHQGLYAEEDEIRRRHESLLRMRGEVEKLKFASVGPHYASRVRTAEMKEQRARRSRLAKRRQKRWLARARSAPTLARDTGGDGGVASSSGGGALEASVGSSVAVGTRRIMASRSAVALPPVK